MPKDPAAGNKTHQPPKRQPPTVKPPVQAAPVAAASQGELVQRALADPASLSPFEVAALQRAVGNRAVQRLLARPDPPDESNNDDLLVQTKLVVGAADDSYEREADRVAQGVMRQIQEKTAEEQVQREEAAEAGAADERAQRAEAAAESERVQRAAADAEHVQRASVAATTTALDYDEEDERETGLKLGRERWGVAREEESAPLQRKFDGRPEVGLAGGDVAQPVESAIQQTRGGGQPLHGGVRRSMEDAFQADFAKVRVHHNRQSDQLNRKLSARAFTTGQDVFFKHGEYNPHTQAGKTLLAHELTHVVQQNGAAVQRKPNKVQRRAGDSVQRVTWDYASMERAKWKKRNTAAKAALVPFGGVYGAGKAAAQTYSGLYDRFRGPRGANASRGRKLAAGLGAGVLGTLALPFALGWGALRGTASGLANPLVSAGKRLPGAWQGIKDFFRQGVGKYRAVPREQRGAVDGSQPVPETEAETTSRLMALGGRRGPVPLPGAGPRVRPDTGLTRGDNPIATGALDIGSYGAMGIGAATAGGRSLTGWSSGATDANFGSSLQGATGAFGALGATAGLAGTLGALVEARSGFNQSTSSDRSGGDRVLGVGQGFSGTSDAVKQASTAAFNIASLTGNAAAAAAATAVAGGAGVVMGVIDVLRGIGGALTAKQRHNALALLLEEIDRKATFTQLQKLFLKNAVKDGLKVQKARLQTAIVTGVKGAVTIAGGAILIAAGLTNPVGWALLGGAALIGGIYALYKLREKSKRKRHLAVRELGIESWRTRWKTKKKKIEDETRWGSDERRQRLKREVGEDPLMVTLRSQGYESPGHFYAVYIKTTAETIYKNAVETTPEPEQPNYDLRMQMVSLVGKIGLRIDRSKSRPAPTIKRIAEVLDN